MPFSFTAKNASSIATLKLSPIWKKSIGKKITCYGAEVTKAVIDFMKIRTKDCIQSQGYRFKNYYIW